jgi:hypothetical protein
VSIDVGPKSAVKNFMQEMEVMRLYRIFSIPASSLIIEKEGTIRFKEMGYRDWTDRESRKRLEEILI